MIKRKVLTAYSLQLTALMALVTAVNLNPGYCEVVDKIVVIVNNEIITQREIDRVLMPIYEQYRALYYGDELVKRLDEARQKVIEQLIEDRLILSEAKKLNIEIDEKDVEARIDEVKKRFSSKEEFDQALSNQGLTLKDLTMRYREQMMTRRLIDQKVGSKVTVSPVEINHYYEEHINEYIQPEETALRNILIRPKGTIAPEKALDLAKEILRRLQEGGDFALLAKEYSGGPNANEGGLMGYVKKGDLLPEIENVVFNLKEGELSGIIQTSLGYHIFKVEEKRERKTLSLSEVRNDVEEAVFREKVKDRLKGWLEALRKNAYIAFK
ncbi:MAG: peptidylprolyl isomerase [Candidatus Omnitrophica bacterium]|nr:peptidylprolyl isomerase [Candidatus Omnitrophota bacterium]